MRYLLLILLATLFATCGQRKIYTDLISFIRDNSDIDTTYVRQTVGCFNRFYKQIDNKYLVEINFAKELDTTDKYEITLDSKAVQVELWVFKVGDASMDNLCTDAVIIDTARPIKKLKIKSGTIEFLNTYDNNRYLTDNDMRYSFILSNATFTDDNGDDIKIGRQLFWDIQNYSELG
jgi:hypothetical protein